MKKTKVISAILALIFTLSLVSVPAFAEATTLPTPDFSFDFSGYSADSTDDSKGIVGTGKTTAITVDSRYITKETVVVSPTKQYSYLQLNVEAFANNRTGVLTEFSDVIGAGADGLINELSVDFWMNIPGDKLTGKYAQYFRFVNSSNTEIFNLYNLNLDTHRLQLSMGNCNSVFVNDYYN